jgi:hypothetical protein
MDQLIVIANSIDQNPILAANIINLDLTDEQLNFLLDNDNRQIYNNIVNLLNNINGLKRTNIKTLLNVILLSLYKKNRYSVNNLDVKKYLTKIYSIINEFVTRYNGKYGSFSQKFTRDVNKLESRIHDLFFSLLYSMNENNKDYKFDDITSQRLIYGYNGGRKTRRNKRKNTKRKNTKRKRSSYRRRK